MSEADTLYELLMDEPASDVRIQQFIATVPRAEAKVGAMGVRLCVVGRVGGGRGGWWAGWVVGRVGGGRDGFGGHQSHV